MFFFCLLFSLFWLCPFICSFLLDVSCTSPGQTNATSPNIRERFMSILSSRRHYIALYYVALYHITSAYRQCQRHRPTLLNSALLGGVGLCDQTNATCTVRTRNVEIRDPGEIMIPNFRPDYLFPLPER